MTRRLMLTLFVVAGSASAGGAELFVSPVGQDSNPGTADQPFATLERARDAVAATAGGGRQTAGWDHDLAPRRRLSSYGGLGTLRRRFGNGRVAGRVAGLAGRNRTTVGRTHAVRVPAGHRSGRAGPVAGKRSWGRAADRPAGAGHPRVRRDEVARLRPADHPRAWRTVLRRQADDTGSLAERRPMVADRRVPRDAGSERRPRRQDRQLGGRVFLCRRSAAGLEGHRRPVGPRLLGVGLGQFLRTGRRAGSGAAADQDRAARTACTASARDSDSTS